MTVISNSTPAVILLSGGLDSTVLLHYAAKVKNHAPIYALSFSYGQKHTKELEMAQWQCSALPQVIEHKIIDLSFFADMLQGASTLVTGGDNVPSLNELNQEERAQPSTYVPNRNMILLSLAAAFAEARHVTDIYYGAQAQDEYGYWDCTIDFLQNINQILSLNRKNKITIHAPFVNWRKAQEIELGLKLGVNFRKTWTCYQGGEHPCQCCPTCIERQTAFNELNLRDPLCD